MLRQRFLGLICKAIAGELTAWGANALSTLALVLLLDQFTRQIWRGMTMACVSYAQTLAPNRLVAELAFLPTPGSWF
jgi:uncharacterized protein (DUF924 family)